MLQEEKRFKMLKVKKSGYEIDADIEKYQATMDALQVGAISVMTAGLLISGGAFDPIASLVAIGAGSFTAFKLKSMVQSIVKKTLFESKIDDINDEFEKNLGLASQSYVGTGNLYMPDGEFHISAEKLVLPEKINGDLHMSAEKMGQLYMPQKINGDLYMPEEKEEQRGKSL